MIDVSVNGKGHRADVEPDTPLLWVIRDAIGLPGTKFDCGMALCGACTVQVRCSLRVTPATGVPVVASRTAPTRARPSCFDNVFTPTEALCETLHDRARQIQPAGTSSWPQEGPRPLRPLRRGHRRSRTALLRRVDRPSATPDGSNIESAVPITLRINGTDRQLRIDPRTTLLDCLRETVALTGTKKGCDHGQCGACTVHVNGRRVNSCLSLAVMHDGEEVTTIEGLGTPDALHPMQAAFVACDGYQCGYCTSGQIMSAVALLKEPCGPDDADVKELMSGNICRCGAYPNIVAAIQQVRRTA